MVNLGRGSTSRDGDEIHCETSRLYIRGRTFSSSRTSVDGAVACHSARRIVEHPALEFVTAGCPRETKWVARASSTFEALDAFERIGPGSQSDLMSDALRCRRAHLVGLFASLPAMVAQALGRQSGSLNTEWLRDLELPGLDLAAARQDPGQLLLMASRLAEP